MASVSDICKYICMCFVISQPFLKIHRLEILYTYSSAIELYHIVRFLKKNILRGKFLKKEKNVENFGNFRNFQNFENPRQQFCSPTNSPSFHIRQLIVATLVAAIPVNPYFQPKSAEHDVTLTSVVAEL